MGGMDQRIQLPRPTGTITAVTPTPPQPGTAIHGTTTPGPEPGHHGTARDG